MNSESLSDISKFLSYVLRHEPQAIGLQLDSDGWVNLCLLYTSPSPRDVEEYRMPSSA